MTIARFAAAALLAAPVLMPAAPALAADVAYELLNDTTLILMEFYTSPSDVAEWGADVLGAEVLAPGEAGVVTIGAADGQCVYDLRFVFEDGSELVDTQDICAMASYTLVH